MTQQNNEMSPGCFTGFMLFFFVISLGLLYWGYSKFTFTRSVMKEGILINATVIDINSMERNPNNQRNSGANQTAPVVEFVYNGDTIQYNSEQYSNVFDHGIGEVITIYVNPDQPEASVINSWSEKWGGAALLFALGGIFFLLSAGSLVSMIFSRS